MTNLCVSAFSPFESTCIQRVIHRVFIENVHICGSFRFQASCVLIANVPYATAFALLSASAKVME